MALKISALELNAEAFEALPDETKAFYDHDTEADVYRFGVAVGDDETVQRVENVEGLKSALHKERDSVRDLRRKVAQMTDNPQADELADRVSRLETENATLKENWTKERATVKLNEAITKHKGVAATLAPVLREMTKTDPETGDVFPVDKDGKAVTDPDTGANMTLDAFVAVMREDPQYASAFIGSGSSGGGTPPGAGGGTGGGKPVNLNQQRSKMKPAEKVAFINEHGHDVFMALPY